MNIAKHMEAIFLAAAAFSLFTGYAQADNRVAQEEALRSATIHEVQTVVVSAKRLTAAEKASFK